MKLFKTELYSCRSFIKGNLFSVSFFRLIFMDFSFLPKLITELLLKP